jgi:hypothetical protein
VHIGDLQLMIICSASSLLEAFNFENSAILAAKPANAVSCSLKYLIKKLKSLRRSPSTESIHCVHPTRADAQTQCSELQKDMVTVETPLPSRTALV